MKYISKKEAEEEFDKYCTKDFGGYESEVKASPNRVKDFITTLELSRLDAIIEHLRGIKRIATNVSASLPSCSTCGFNNDHRNCQCDYNQAIDDQITYLEELRKTLV